VAIVPKFVEVADRIWVARYDWADVNITAIGGERGLVVVDTHGSAAAGRMGHGTNAEAIEVSKHDAR
jgi:hypothetical protein